MVTSNPFITALISLSLTSIGLFFLERPRLESPRLETGRLQTPHLEKPHLERPHLETPSAKQASALPRQVHGKNLFSQVLPLLLAFGATYAVFRLLTGSNQIALAIALLGSALPSLVAKRRLIQRKKELAASWPEAMDAIMHPIETMKSLPGKIAKGFDAVRKGLSGQGSVTTTEREVSRTVTPGKKRGGRAC